MKCSKCQLDNPEKARFCMGCGHNLALPCESHTEEIFFDEKLAKIQRYLPKGLAEKILSQKDKIEGERKQVTVMFCDMEGFTSLVKRLGSEEAYSVMDQIYEILIHKVRDFEGTVNEMTGDGVIALFGAPITLGDDTQRALRSALSIHSEIDKFNDQRKGTNPIKMRIGIHTGPVVVGALGNDLRVEFKAVGDTVNLASRMEGLAEPGTTFVTKDTFKLTEGLFRFEPQGRIRVKGMVEAVTAYKLLSAKQDLYRPRLGFERMIYSEMVGREKELDSLELQVMKVINGEGSVVNIIGEAGIGKSRLIAELKERRVINRVSLFEGRAVSIGRNLSFHPIIDIFKQWAKIKENDSKATALNKLEASVRQILPEEMEEVFPFVATLMGMKLSGRHAERVKGIEGEALEKLILKNVRDLLIKSADLRPVVIIIEDLHWSDTSSIELMESIFRLAETKQILFVNVFRPGHKETGDRIVDIIKERLPEHSVEIVLKPLDEKISETLISNMLNMRDLQRAVIDKIVERAGGNPFFIEEVVRSFIDEGAVIAKKGSFQVTKKIDNMIIPHTINDLIIARIDRLEEETRNLVKVASVIGRNFFYRILTEVASTIKDIDKKLSYLKKIQLIRERKRMEELEYLFKHALAQEAAYESILIRKKKEIHLIVAYSIEKVFEDRLHEFYGMLSYHYSKAEDLDKAEEYLIKAGEDALKASASSEALHYYKEALNLYLKKSGQAANPEKKAMLEQNIAIALYNKGHSVEAVKYFDKALAYYGVKFPKYLILATIKTLVDFITFLISMYIPVLRPKKIPTEKDSMVLNLFHKKTAIVAVIDPMRLLIEGINLFKRISKFDLRKIDNGVGMFTTASVFFSYGGISFRLSKKILGIIIERIDKDNVKERLFYEFSDLFHNLLSGEWEEIKEYDENLVELGLKIGEIFFTSNYINLNSLFNIENGNFTNAQKIAKKLSDVDYLYDHSYTKALRYCLNTKVLMKYRRINEALILSKEGVDVINRLGEKMHLLSVYSFNARIHIMIGDNQKAAESLKAASKIKSDIQMPYYLTDFFLSHFIFDICRLEDAIEMNNRAKISKFRRKALKSGRKAVRISKRAASDRTEILRLMGTYYWLIGKQIKALGWWSNSIDEGERLGARLELSRTYMEVGKRLLDSKSQYKELKRVKANEYLEKARIMLKEMNLHWDLDELDKIG